MSAAFTMERNRRIVGLQLELDKMLQARRALCKDYSDGASSNPSHELHTRDYTRNKLVVAALNQEIDKTRAELLGQLRLLSAEVG